MCHNRINNRKINRLHERYLRIIYNDKTSSFKILLEKDDFLIIIKDLLIIEMFKTNRGILSSIMKGIFEPRVKHRYNLRCISQFFTPLLSTVFYGTENIGAFFQKLLKTLIP